MLGGSLLGVAIQLLLAAQPAAEASPAGLTALSPLLLFVPLVVQFALVRPLATTPRLREPWNDEFWDD